MPWFLECGELSRLSRAATRRAGLLGEKSLLAPTGGMGRGGQSADRSAHSKTEPGSVRFWFTWREFWYLLGKSSVLVKIGRDFALVRRVPTGVRRVPTGVRRVLTGVRRVLTGERRVLTGVRRVLTDVRRVLTGVRRVLTGVRRVLTGVRQVLTGVRRVLTGVRRVLTGLLRGEEASCWVVAADWDRGRPRPPWLE